MRGNAALQDDRTTNCSVARPFSCLPHTKHPICNTAFSIDTSRRIIQECMTSQTSYNAAWPQSRRMNLTTRVPKRVPTLKSGQPSNLFENYWVNTSRPSRCGRVLICIQTMLRSSVLAGVGLRLAARYFFYYFPLLLRRRRA